ncbi:MAG: hypothetical protein A3B03_02795 [Candidatus Zambryskibacteria bacterium RIFCSPLOWO2_01_FULL_42_41]|nr:MAG: hypothetical protein A3B03_02795 [Candidatus Zambryskibacteria bacterium RIFCSPLOWO2_01_FULL_42_41]
MQFQSDLLRRIDEVARRGQRSQFVREAVEEKLQRLAQAKLAAELEEGYRTNAERMISEHRDWLI